MNPSEAFVWSKKSADQGNLQAAFVVGYMYSQGLGTPRDMAQANYWVEKASKDPEVAKSLQAGRESAGQTRHVDGVNEMLPKTEAGQTQLIMTLIKALDKGPSPHDACEQKRMLYEQRFNGRAHPVTTDNCTAQDPTWYDQK